MKRILIVDDNPSIRLLYQEELVEEGYDVISSDGGGDLLPLIAEQTPDLILLDLKLGKRNGLDLLQDIRQNSWTIPVILLKAYPSFKLDSKSVSAYASVTKNSDLTGLKQQIEKCLNDRNRPHERQLMTGQEPHAAVLKPAVQLGMRLQE